MNLAQAYQGWQQQSQNRELYKNTKEAFRKAWFTLPTNKPCSYYTKEVLGMALAETRVIESFKAKAASVMCHVLAFANWAEPKFNPMPDFNFEDLMEYTKGPLADPNKVKPKENPSHLNDDDDINDLDIDPITGLPRKTTENETELPTEDVAPVLSDSPALSSRPREGDISNETTTEEIKTNETMEPMRTRGRQARKVCQIDPMTLQVIRTYNSCCEAQRITGAKNIDRAAKKLQAAANYYWQYPEDVPTFAERLKQKQKITARVDEVPVLAPAATEPAPIVKLPHDLSNFSDQELFTELELRGYQGELQIIKKVTIGTKNE